MLTPRQERVFRALVELMHKTGQPVASRALTRELGDKSTCQAHNTIRMLMSLGYVGPVYGYRRNGAHGYIPLKYPDWLEREAT